MSKSRIVLCLLVVAALLLVGCDGQKNTPVPPVAQVEPTQVPTPKPASIKFMCWSDTIGTADDVKANLLDPFGAKTGIKVSVEILPWGEYWTKLQTLSAAGQMPDVYCMSGAYIWEHAEKKMALNVQSWFNRDVQGTDYFMELTRHGNRYPTTEGDLYSVPFRWVAAGIFYNKDLFDAAGVAYPTDQWTYDDMLKAARDLTKDTDGDGKVDQWGMYAALDHIFFDVMIAANGGQLLTEDGTGCRLDEPVAVEALQWMVDAVNKYQVSPPPGLVGSEEGQFKAGVFPSGRVAMVIDGSYNLMQWKDLPFKWDVSWQPKGKVSRLVYGGTDSLSIAAAGEHQNEAWEFVKYFLSPEIQNNPKVIGPGGIPFLKSAATSDAVLKAPGYPSNFKVFVESAPYLWNVTPAPAVMEWRFQAMPNELSPALLGKKSAREAATAACKGIEAVLSASR